MGAGRLRWFSRLFGLLASVTALFLTSVSAGNGDDATTVTAPNPRCVNDKSYMLISTLDGSVSALDLNQEGTLAWSVQADVRPLLSSSLENLEVIQDGISTRFLPSLDGGLYQFDGVRVSPVPHTAESLLSSSSRLSDDTMMIGGKDIKTYGIDTVTGKVRYVCTAAGCQYCGSSDVSSEDIMVITRTTNTVRAVDARSGQEKWNFSVGQHEIRHMPSSPVDSTDKSNNSLDDDATIVICPDNDNADESFMNTLGDNYKSTLKFIVPDGNIVALNPEDPSKVLWQHKLSSPIARAWLLRRGRFEALNLFDQRHNPALSNLPTDENVPHESFLYLGFHNRQMYVQASVPLSETMANIAASAKTSSNGAMIIPQVSWRPYLSRAGAQTPLLRGNYHDPSLPPGSASEERSLTIWTEEYPFDNGYYLYPDFQKFLHIEMVPPENKTVEEPSSMIRKENVVAVVVTSLCLALLIHIMMHRYGERKLQAEAEETRVNKSDSYNSNAMTNSKSDFDLTEPLKPEAEFKSRFSQEFEMTQCLGKGGFGVVFEAKNRMDDCSYAVKRIALPNREDAREKMMREVKALAKLDHSGIVRYFHAWLETPPSGWQEAWDKQIEDSELFTRTPCNSGAEITVSEIPSAKVVPRRPLSPRETVPMSLFLQESILGSGSDLSGGFSAHSDLSTDESGSFSLGVGEELAAHVDSPGPPSQRKKVPGSSVFRSEEFSTDSIVFQHEDSAVSGGIESGSDEALNCSRKELGVSSCSPGGKKLLDKSNSAVEDQRTSWKDRLSSLNVDSMSGKTADDTCSEAFTFGENTESSSILFQHELGSSECGTSSGDQGLPFQKYQGSQNQQDSFSVVFEDSGCRDRSSNEGGSGIEGRRNSSSADSRNAEGRKGDHIVQMESSGRRQPRSGLDVEPKAYLYIQMQLCRRETLKDWLCANYLRDESVLDIFDQIVSAVEYVHHQGLMHRDLKPSNIFFSMDGAIKIGDFGLVTALSEQQDQPVSSQECQKHTAEVGTQLYMSPEQIAKKPYDFKVDIFSLGMIFFELLVPFDTQMERIRSLQNVKKLNFPSTFQSEKADEFEFLQRLLSHDPNERPTAQQILDNKLLEAYAARRVDRRFRTRTISSNSNSSDKL